MILHLKPAQWLRLHQLTEDHTVARVAAMFGGKGGGSFLYRYEYLRCVWRWKVRSSGVAQYYSHDVGWRYVSYATPPLHQPADAVVHRIV